jgi:hypothetical protein
VTGSRRFPPPWTIEEANDACFIVKDHNGHALAYVYFENEPGRRTAANLLTRDEARRHRRQHRQAHGAGRRRFLRLGLIKLPCWEPDAADRVRAAMSLIEHEWLVTEGTDGRRIFVEISDKVIRTFR